GHRATGDADVHVGTGHHVDEPAGTAEHVGGLGGKRPRSRREVLAAGVQHALTVEDGEVADPGLEQDAGNRHAGGAGALDHDPGPRGRAAGETERVLQGGERDHGGAVLVVVEDGDVEQLL